MAGYSATPLWKKLGYSSGMRTWVTGEPAGYRKLLILPGGVKVAWLKAPEPGMTFVHVFAREAAQLQRQLSTLRREIVPTGVVWVSWPKKTSGVVT